MKKVAHCISSVVLTKCKVAVGQLETERK